jgi:hypothetical protein
VVDPRLGDLDKLTLQLSSKTIVGPSPFPSSSPLACLSLNLAASWVSMPLCDNQKKSNQLLSFPRHELTNVSGAGASLTGAKKRYPIRKHHSPARCQQYCITYRDIGITHPASSLHIVLVGDLVAFMHAFPGRETSPFAFRSIWTVV